jgi:predicted AAA+ superfamily ATPase
LLKANARFASLWRRNYLDSVVQGDMRDLTRIRDLDLVENLIELLPWRVGAPFSVNAVREDLEVAHATVKTMMNHLERLLFTFSLEPYTKKVTRPVKKERKVYLYDWSSIENPGTRFENFVAIELLARTRLWTESGGDEWGLQFVRNREGKETDFLILRRRKPWCLLECKTRKAKVESHHLLFARKLGKLPVIQLLREHGAIQAKDRDVVSISASRFFA